MSDRSRFLLDESRIPKAWYNVNADLPTPPTPVLHPGTMEPVTPEFLSVLFPMNLVMQEVTPERWVEIPEPVREIYRLWRPTPMIRALRLEKALDTPAHIYFKNESVSPVGSHKTNTAVAAGLLQQGGRDEGADDGDRARGSGERRSRMACNFFDLDLEVFMVRVSYHQKPYRRIVMENYGAHVFASPTDRTHFGRKMLEEDEDSPGLARHRDLRGGGDGRDERREEEVQPRVGARARDAAPDGHRPRGARADGDGGRVPRRRHRLRGRRIELRRLHVPVRPPEPDRGEEDARSSRSSRPPARR